MEETDNESAMAWNSASISDDEGAEGIMDQLVAMHSPSSSSSSSSPPPALSAAIANPKRLSMEDYYTRHSLTISRIPQGPPPSYELAIVAPTSGTKSIIQPREDEGHEQLPGYSSSISLEAVFSKKNELEGAIHKAHDRNWSRIYVTLQGTALTFYNFTSPGMLAKHQLAQKTPDLPAGTKRGSLIKSYNLQHADVGIAADYLKRPYVIRVRAEGDQFLLSCKRIETFVQWLQSLCAAIDLAPPLDEREIPKDHSVPRPARLRRRPPVATVPEEGPRSSSNSLAASLASVSSDAEDEAGPSTSTADASPSSSASTSDATPVIAPSRTRPTHLLQDIHSSSTPHPYVSNDGKWRPVHKWGPSYDMMYARRCMAILTHRSPRKSNMVIMKGTQWIVDWATGVMTRWGPPEYGDVVKEGGVPLASTGSTSSSNHPGPSSSLSMLPAATAITSN